MRVEDLDPDRVVYKATRSFKVVHLRESCHQLNDKYSRRRAVLLHDGVPICSSCSDGNRRSRTSKESATPFEQWTSNILAEMEPEDLGL